VAEPFRILFAIPELDSGGPDRVFHEIIRGLDHKVFAPQLVVSIPGGRYFDALPEDVEKCVIGGGRYPVRRFARAVDQLRPDLVFSTLRMNVTAATALHLQRHRPPIIARQANAIAVNFQELKKGSLVKHYVAELVVTRLLKVPVAVVVQSEDMASEVAKYTRSGQDVVTIGNPVSLSDLEKRRALEPLASSDSPWGEPAIVAVGRLEAQKGFDLLLPAFSQLLSSFPRARLSIWGEGSQRDSLVALCESLNIGGAVRFPGTTEAVLSEVSNADLLVSSSRYEGFSNVLLEAMALGTPVVATNCPGATKELIIDGKTGTLVPTFGVDAIRDGMLRALRADSAGIASAARLHVEANFGKEVIVRQYTDLFERHV
jgi:glycosyltransferase involved in cell wall biosynthesis